MRYRLNLPKGVYVSILTLLLFTTIIYSKVESAFDKQMINYFSGLFVMAVIHGSLLIRMGNFDIYKNVLNAIWNIQTAFAFIYGIYIVIEYSSVGLKKPEIITKMFNSDDYLFILAVVFLSAVCVARAGYSVAEIFKNPIIESRKKQAEYQQGNAPD
ncbi:hypothetical protein QPJ96_03165 [Pantoea agglomerans]|nr:hypothetical protein [Pantoea agglomerans]WIL42590.1 hypothetical protein QPJ96_03165 [Pantoea agglomerans]